MKVLQLPKSLALGPEELRILSAAYDFAVAEFQLPDRAFLLKEGLGRAICDIARSGERDPDLISQQAVQKLARIQTCIHQIQWVSGGMHPAAAIRGANVCLSELRVFPILFVST